MSVVATLRRGRCASAGLRRLQGRKELTDIIKRVRAAMDKSMQPHAPPPAATPAHPHPPLLIKIAPDLSADDRADIAAVALAKAPAVDGLVISNTTVSRPPAVRGSAAAAEAGGLSGAPVMAASTEVLADMYCRTGGAVPLVGCGGVMNGGDAYAKIRAGASLVEVYTGMVWFSKHTCKGRRGDAATYLLDVAAVGTRSVQSACMTTGKGFALRVLISSNVALDRMCGVQGELPSSSGASATGCMQVYKGPSLIPEAKRELLRCLEADGFSSVEQAIGADHR